MPVYDMRTLESHLAQNRLSVSLLSAMFSIFAAIALVLASVGLCAVIAHSVSRRTEEIGVRMAMGGTHVLRTALVGVSPSDPMTFLAVVLVLALAGVLGCAIPARRALRVEPVVALRHE